VKDHMRELLRSMARLLDAADARVLLSGHTDASPYGGGERGYSNWELSADRANASRRELVAGGLREDRVVRVMGLGSSTLYEPSDPLSPQNRRISILVLGKLGQERWARGAEVPVSETQALEQLLDRRPPGEAPAAAVPVTPAAPNPPVSSGATP